MGRSENRVKRCKVKRAERLSNMDGLDRFDRRQIVDVVKYWRVLQAVQKKLILSSREICLIRKALGICLCKIQIMELEKTSFFFLAQQE